MPRPGVGRGSNSWTNPGGWDALLPSPSVVTAAAGLPSPVYLALEREAGLASSHGGEAAAQAREEGGAAASEGVPLCSRQERDPWTAAVSPQSVTCSPSVSSSVAPHVPGEDCAAAPLSTSAALPPLDAGPCNDASARCGSCVEELDTACLYAGSPSGSHTNEFSERLRALLDFEQNLSPWDLAPEIPTCRDEGLLPSPLVCAAPEAAGQQSTGGDEGWALASAAAAAAQQRPAGSPKESALRPAGSSQA